MDKNKIICPACGSTSFEVAKTKKVISEPYSNPVEVFIDEYNCLVCGMQGDFTKSNDEIIDRAIEQAKHNSVFSIIEYFNRNDISMSAFERALDLPQRTLTKWKNGLSNPSATGFALMNIVRTYPWILEVAQSKYDPVIAKKVYISSALNDFLSWVPIDLKSAFRGAGVVTTQESHIFYAHFDKNAENDFVPLSTEIQVETGKDKYSIKNISFAEVE